MHDSDRLTPLSGKVIVLENKDIKLSFDTGSGALLQLLYKKTGWEVERRSQLGDSFRMFVPMKDRSYSPIVGARNRLASYRKSENGQSLTLVWQNLQSEYAGTLDITATGVVRIEGSQALFDLTVANHSPLSIHTVSWPILGDLSRPSAENKLTADSMNYGGLGSIPLYPNFSNPDYFGTSYPQRLVGGRFVLVSSDTQGLYQSSYDSSASGSIHDLTMREFDLKPGYEDGFDQKVSLGSPMSGHPARMSEEVVHYPYIAPGETASLATSVINPYQGDWHSGVDIFKGWRATWFHRPVAPQWVTDINAWQQIQINSAEDDLRTRYLDLPRRAAQAAANGIAAIQLVGWNNGGQDRGNPSHDTDPRLGTYDDLKNAIAEIQKMGVHIILFNKYVWADMSTKAYKDELYRHMATDPYGIPYTYHGYRYQTPEQLANINTRRFGVACTNDRFWRDLSAREFKKSINLGASGMLFDESGGHNATFCFSPDHGHRVPDTLASGDERLGEMFRGIVHGTVGEDHYLMSGEWPADKLALYYSLSYFRIEPGYIPLDRYIDPFQPIMIAVVGFDDREMINRALMYRFIISYEPFNFKGNLADFPLTVTYGKKVDSLRRRYRSYLWDAEFRDTLEASLTVDRKPYEHYTVFRRTTDGKHAVIVTNVTNHPILASVSFLHPRSLGLASVSPEDPIEHPCDGTVEVPVRSTVVILER